MEFYEEAIKDCETSIQLGDFGVGFLPVWKLELLDEQKPTHRFLRGNHDDPGLCLELGRNIRSGTIENDCFFLGGAWSIDQEFRTPGLSWWRGEQHTTGELVRFLELYLATKPKVVISHDCPSLVAYHLFLKNKETTMFLTRTGEVLQRMLELHQPERWYFGHWHQTRTAVIEGCEFSCLGINTVKDIEW